MARLTFGIPLISRRVTRDWKSTEQLLAATLRSVFNQSETDLRVIIACHERPSIVEIEDPRVFIVEVGFDIPRFRWEMEIDRMRKLEVIGAKLRSFGGGKLFILDGDDLVSCNLAKEIISANTKAVVIQNGYRLDAKRSIYQRLSKLWGKCGSCIAVQWEVDELPIAPLQENPPIYHEFCENRHYVLPAFFKKIGWSVTFIQKPLVVYITNHGSNQSEVIVQDSLKWRLYFLLQQWKPWTPALDKEFGVDPAVRQKGVYQGRASFSTEAPN